MAAVKKWTPPAGAKLLLPVPSPAKKWPSVQPEVPQEVTNRYVKKENIAKFAIAEGGSYDLLAKLGIAKPMPKPETNTPAHQQPDFSEYTDVPKENMPSGLKLLANVGSGDRNVLTKRTTPVVSQAYRRAAAPPAEPTAVAQEETKPSIPAWRQRLLEKKAQGSSSAAIAIATPKPTSVTKTESPSTAAPVASTPNTSATAPTTTTAPVLTPTSAPAPTSSSPVVSTASTPQSVISRWQPPTDSANKPLLKVQTKAPTPSETASAASAALASTTAPAAANTEEVKLYSYQELLQKPGGVNMARLEVHLHPEEFPKVFKLASLAEFQKLPLWKQKQLKMGAKLF